MKYFYILAEDEDFGPSMAIVSEKDYKAGYNASYIIPQEITDFLYRLGCPELQEGIYEVHQDLDELKFSLNNFGLEEKTFQE
jgi:hypothetical protein